MPVGLLIDHFQFSTTSKLRLLSFSCVMLPIGYLLLIWGVPSSSSSSSSSLAPTSVSIASSVLTSTTTGIISSQTHQKQQPHLLSMMTTTINDTPHHPSYVDDHWYPTLVMVFLGLSYALSNCFFWSTLNDVLPSGTTKATANGLVACGLNILPSVIPPLLTSTCRWLLTINALYLHDMFPLFLLAGLAVAACMFAVIASTLTGSQSIDYLPHRSVLTHPHDLSTLTHPHNLSTITHPHNLSTITQPPHRSVLTHPLDLAFFFC